MDKRSAKGGCGEKRSTQVAAPSGVVIVLPTGAYL
jgi:hypothetical protein